MGFLISKIIITFKFMKKTKDKREKVMMLNFLETKFNGIEVNVKVSPINPNYITYYLGRTKLIVVQKLPKKTNFVTYFERGFLDECRSWFSEFNYKEILREWLFSNSDIQLPEGCVLYFPPYSFYK